MPPLALQTAALLAVIQPWPLQEFKPVQDELAVLHSDVPLHELIPAHLTPPSAEAGVTNVLLASASVSAAAAIAAPDLPMCCIFKTFQRKWLRE